MIAAILIRNYKNYANLNFIPIANDIENMFSMFIGNNGVGKSAVLEAIDLFFNNRTWNVTQGTKKTEAYVCPLFLVPKSSVSSSKKQYLEIISDYFWSDKAEQNPNTKNTPALQEMIKFRDSLKKKYLKTHYLVLCGVAYDSGRDAFFGSFNKNILDALSEEETEARVRANIVRDYLWQQYTYLYIPVEESPQQLLQLQNEAMQKLLNKDILQEIEKILTRKEDGSSGATIVKRINQNLDTFINEVNSVISSIDSGYSFSAETGTKKSLTAKDIRAKIIEAYFPLRALKYSNKRVDLLSSGEQRKAIIDIAYSTLVANKGRKTDKEVILAIDEPESSMHISNCFDQFIRLEELTRGESKKQVLLTTHWYGFLPIAEHGMLHHISKDLLQNQPQVVSFDLYNLLENRKNYPDDVSLKSMFDLAASMMTFMRQKQDYRWIICEGSDDKVYLETMLEGYKDLRIIPLGGCGNVVKLYQMLFGYMTEKNGDHVSKIRTLFLIDTDLQMLKVQIPFQYSTEKTNTNLRRLQIVKGKVSLIDPTSSSTYSQTEMEDCLNPEMYWQAVSATIEARGTSAQKKALKNVEFVEGASLSLLRGDDSCICPKEGKFLKDKKAIIAFAENTSNKYAIANKYASLSKGKNVQHELTALIVEQLQLSR